MIPNQVKVGAHRFSVVKLPGADMPSPAHCGQTRLTTLRIYINEDMPLSMQWETLTHEIVHAMRMLTGTELANRDEEEKVVQNLGHILYQFLVDNSSALDELVDANVIQIL